MNTKVLKRIIKITPNEVTKFVKPVEQKREVRTTES